MVDGKCNCLSATRVQECPIHGRTDDVMVGVIASGGPGMAPGSGVAGMIPGITVSASRPDMVNHPAHYTRGPMIRFKLAKVVAGQTVGRIIECIEVIRHVNDMRLANAMKYIWRVAFGGKANDREDIEKAIFYLKDWLEHPAE